MQKCGKDKLRLAYGANRNPKERGITVMATLELFDRMVREPQEVNLGKVVERDNVRSAIGTFHVVPKYRVTYPEIVIRALGELYFEYNNAFIPLVEKNREWDSDYRFCTLSKLPVNFAVQIDMVGLPDSFLRAASGMSFNDVKEILRRRIYEIENSLAMYQLLERCCANGDGKDSFFKKRFRMVLSKTRKRFGGRKIALLAVTDQKYNAMMEYEFGKQVGEELSDAEVRELSGFDRFFGPASFQKYVLSNGGKCDYLLYVRSSDPVSRLKNPNLKVEHPLLSDNAMRKIIKEHAITFNVDAPEMDHARRINDTKEYQPRLGMGFPIGVQEDMLSLEFATHLYAGKPYANYEGERLSAEFIFYLRGQGIDPEDVESGKQALRCKPIKCAYGCYGHVSGPLTEQKFRGELRRNMRQRGAYIVQPELSSPVITNGNGVAYTYIDRNFMGIVNEEPVFIGGFRSLMPINCHEVKNGRNHGNGATIWAEIIA